MDRAGHPLTVTAQIMELNTATGRLRWVNADHPAPLLIRNHEVTGPLEAPVTLPAGLGGDPPTISEEQLQRGDRVLCYTDGVIEERDARGELFGEQRLIHCVNTIERARADEGIRAGALWLSHTLKRERGERTSDDATVFLIEWRGGATDHPTILE